MMHSLEILSQNKDYLFSTYGGGFHSLMGVLLLLSLVDVIFKGWAMWRAARMGKNYWFIALLVINSMGVFPVIFLLLTNSEYETLLPEKPKSPVKTKKESR